MVGDRTNTIAMRRARFGRRDALLAIAASLVCATIAAGLGPVRAQTDYTPTVLITGSNRGLGFEFARQYAARGWQVIATARHPDEAADLEALARHHSNVVIEQLDVLDHAMIDGLAEKYRGTPIDILINNAGISGGGDTQYFGRIDYEPFDTVMATNVVGPLKMAEAFLGHVLASRQKKIITISSSQGSIGQVRVGMLYFYRASKTAVNMVMTNLSRELKPKGVTVALVAPGATDTDFMQGLKIPLGRPEDRVRAMMSVIDELTLEKTGTFTEYSNESLPW